MRTVVAGREQEVHFAVNTLGYSRRFHFVAMECEDAEHTYESLILSFEYLGGVTTEVLVDNQKTEVLSHRVGAAVEFNRARRLVALDGSGKHIIKTVSHHRNRAHAASELSDLSRIHECRDSDHRS